MTREQKLEQALREARPAVVAASNAPHGRTFGDVLARIDALLSQPEQAEQSEREAFEAWMHTYDCPPDLEGAVFDNPNYPNAECFGQFVYDETYTQRCWAAWQARATRPTPAQTEQQPAEVMCFQYRHPKNGETHTVSLTRKEVAERMSEELFEKLTAAFCECEPVGETNVVDCRCDEYADEFELVAEAPIAPAPQLGPNGSADRYFFEQGFEHGKRAAAPQEQSGLVEALEHVSEGAQMLQSLIDNIESRGNYSQESTVLFLNQVLGCIRAALPQGGREHE